jgi:hypothetical protein
MKSKYKIFDLTQSEDLPPKIAEHVKSNSLRRHDARILSLFDIKDVLTPTEIMVGLYRMYKLERSIQAIHTALCKLKKEGFVKTVRKGIYRKISEPEMFGGDKKLVFETPAPEIRGEDDILLFKKIESA